MAKVVIFHGLGTDRGTLTVRLYRRENHASYANATRDTLANGAAETAAEETNRKGTYVATGITNGSGGDLSGPYMAQLDDSDGNFVGSWWVDMEGVGTTDSPVVADNDKVDMGGISGSAKASDRASKGWKAVESGTAQAGASTTITLASTASAVDDFYLKASVSIVGGVGVGQTRKVLGYVGSTKVATVAAWATNPDNTSIYEIIGRIE